jgi:hypothetical protein
MHHVNDPWANATILGKQVWDCIGPKAEKKDTIEFGKPICDPWGPTTRAKNAQSWPQVCFGPHS